MLKRGIFCSLFEEAGEGTGGGGGGSETAPVAAPPAQSLKDSVLNAFAQAEKEAGAVPVVEDKTPPVVEDKTKVPPVEEETIEVDASPEEIASALTLMRSLGDPARRGEVIKELAKIGGYDLSDKKEVAKLERDAKTILKEKLGDNYDLLGGDKLAEAFEAIMETEVDKRTKPVIDKFNEAETEANTQKANAAMDALWGRHKVTDAKVRDAVAGKMLEKMTAMPANAKTDINTYLDDIYALVTRDQDRARTVKTTVRKIADNAAGVDRTAPGEGGGVDETRVRTGSKLPSVKEAVAAAFRGERLE